MSNDVDSQLEVQIAWKYLSSPTHANTEFPSRIRHPLISLTEDHHSTILSGETVLSLSDPLTDMVEAQDPTPTESRATEPVETPQDEEKAVIQGAEVEEQTITVRPVLIRLPAPTHPRTLPKPKADYSTLTLLPQPHETIQELKLAVNESLGGYWIGPYALRIPLSTAKMNGHVEKERVKGDVKVEIRAGERLSEWAEVGDVFGDFGEDEERVLEVAREPYTDFTARQTVLRLLELISPPGTTNHHLSNPVALSPGSTIFESVRDGLSLSSEPVYQEVELSVAKKGKGKKEVVKVKREISGSDQAHAFVDFKEATPVSIGQIPMSQPLMDAQVCLKGIQLSAFNPPPAHLRQQGHQLYLQITTLENDTLTLICVARGWYVSRSTTISFDPSPRNNSTPTHSLLDLLHSLSPQFSECLSHLPPLSSDPPKLEPISTVPIPQAEPSYPWLVSPPTAKSTSAEILRTQMAYLHTGATSPEGLDGARDWNEEIQGVRELPKGNMQERVVREKIAQKTWAEFTSASVRSVLAVARGDVPPLNPNENPRAHMFLHSNIFITKAVDSIDAYSHLGGDAAAHVNHAKDANGVEMLNKLDLDGVSLLGHTVVDWMGGRWVCQSVLPGIFSRRAGDESEARDTDEVPDVDGEKEKSDWVKIENVSPQSTPPPRSKEDEDHGINDEPNPLIIYGLDSESPSVIHYDLPTHKLFAKIAEAYHLAPHIMVDGQGVEREFYASVDVKGLRGTDGRRYLLDLPRIMPVDVEFLEKDIEGPIINGEDGEDGEKYPHRVVLLRPELVEAFWEGELKIWARKREEREAGVAGTSEEGAKKEDDKGEEGNVNETTDTQKSDEIPPTNGTADLPPAVSSFAAMQAAADGPVPPTITSDKLKAFELVFNPDAFVDQPLPKSNSTSNGSSNSLQYVPSKITDHDETSPDPSVTSVREASKFLRSVAIPTMILDVLTGALNGIMDGISLTRVMHGKGINVRYLGWVMKTVEGFSKGAAGAVRKEIGHLGALKEIVNQEMIFRASKHILRSLIAPLSTEQVPAAVSHFLNCLLGADHNSSPKAVYEPLDLDSDHTESAPEYVDLKPITLRERIVQEVRTRFRWLLDEEVFGSLRKPQLLRELAGRVAFQLVQREYSFANPNNLVNGNGHVNGNGTGSENGHGHVNGNGHLEEKKEKEGKGKKGKEGKERKVEERITTFVPEDVVCWVPVVKATSPSCSVAEEIFEAGRSTLNRGQIDLGLEFLQESIQIYESVHQVLHPAVAAAYNQYASTIHQLARLKIAQSIQSDIEQPLGIDLATALRWQRQAVIIAERTLGVWDATTIGYYVNLAMLENLEGNAKASLRYFRHILDGWEVIYGKDHPEIATVLSNTAIVLQSLSDPALALYLLQRSHQLTAKLFGETHLQTAQTLHQLTQAHFISGDIPAALTTATTALKIFEDRLGAEHGQTKEAAKNVDLLKAVVEGVERQKAATEESRRRLAQRVGGSAVRRALAASSGSVPVPASLPEAVPVDSRIGERGHLDVDELVQFIQGQSGGGGKSRGTKGLRGKRRTGAKR